MKTILSIIAVVALGAGSVFANCGKKVETTGKLKSFDAETKTLVVVAKGKESTITLTPTTEIKKGKKEIEITELVGKKVKVVSEHDKADSVTG
jgi:hypothetical protein